MSDDSTEIDELLGRLDDVENQLDRHRRILKNAADEPDAYGDVDVGGYLDRLDETLRDGDFLGPAEAAAAPLESVVEENEREFLASAEVVVDGETVEGGEFLELEPDGDPPRARMLVESPLINQLRGGSQRLVFGDGRSFTFAIAETLVADVADDKTGDLELEIELDEI